MGGGLAYFVATNQRNLNEAALIDGARHYSEFFTEMRSFYLTEILGRLDSSDVFITHDYRNFENALPIPATMSLEFGEYLAEHSSDVTIALISDYPFPWREDRSLTAFDERAISQLRTMGTGEYSEIFDENGLPYVHYASPVLMSQGCVDCHNNHPDSPKTDWRVGDIRGIQVVEIPVNDAVTALDYEIAVVLSIIATMGFVVIMTLLVLNQRSVYAAESLKAQNKRLQIARQNVAEANQAKSVFLANMNQDIRTPLYSIVGMLSLIDTDSLSAKNKDTVNIIKRSSDALLRIVTQAVKFQSQNEITNRPETGSCDIRATIANACNPFRLLAEHAEGNFTHTVDNGVPQFTTLDEAKTEQLISTLLSLINVNADTFDATVHVSPGADGSKTENASLIINLSLKSKNIFQSNAKLVATFKKLTNVVDKLTTKTEQFEQFEQFEQLKITIETIDRILNELGAKISLKNLSDDDLSADISIPYKKAKTEKVTSLPKDGKNRDEKFSSLAIDMAQNLEVSIINKNKIHTNIISNALKKYKITHTVLQKMPNEKDFGNSDVKRVIMLDADLYNNSVADDIDKIRSDNTKLVVLTDKTTPLLHLDQIRHDAIVIPPVTPAKISKTLAKLFPKKASE